MKTTTKTSNEHVDPVLTLRSTAINAIQYVSVEDVLGAFGAYPYQQVISSLHHLIMADPLPLGVDNCARFVIWSTPASHAVLVKLYQLSQATKDNPLTIADAIMMDLLLSAAYQQAFLGTPDFFHLPDEALKSMLRQTSLQSKTDKTFPSTVTLDLESLSSTLYPGVYTQARWESRMRWMQNAKKHASVLRDRGYLSSASPREGEVGRLLQVELSPSLYSVLAESWVDTPVYTSSVPCLAFRIGRGSARQLPSAYITYRLLYTTLGVKYGTVVAGVSRELSFTEFYEATRLPTYDEWSQQNVLIANPTRYCESIVATFKTASSLLDVQILYQEQRVVITPRMDVYVSEF